MGTVCTREQGRLGAERGPEDEDTIAIPRQVLDAAQEQFQRDLPRAVVLPTPAEPSDRLRNHALPSQ